MTTEVVRNRDYELTLDDLLRLGQAFLKTDLSRLALERCLKRIRC